MPRLQTISARTKLALIDNIRSFVVAKNPELFSKKVNSVLREGERLTGQGVTVLLFSRIKGIH